MILVTLAMVAFPAVAEEVDDILANYQGIPAYCLIVDPSSPVVDNGDEFDVKFYISGAGDVDFGQISITIPPELVGSNEVLYSYVSEVIEGHVKLRNETGGARRQYRLNPICYKRGVINDSVLPILVGEANYEEQPAFFINFIIADDAPAGDHTITIVHFYKNSSKWYLDKHELKIHVNAWYEKGNFGYSHLSWQTIAIGLTVLTIFITFIYQLSKIITLTKNIWMNVNHIYVRWVVRRLLR